MRIAVAFMLVLASACGRAGFDLQANHAFAVDSGWAQYRAQDGGLYFRDAAQIQLYPGAATCETAPDFIPIHEDDRLDIDVRTPGLQLPVGIVPITPGASDASLADGGPHARIQGRIGPNALRVEATEGTLEITASDQSHLAGRLDAKLVLMDGGEPAGTFVSAFDVPYCVAF